MDNFKAFFKSVGSLWLGLIVACSAMLMGCNANTTDETAAASDVQKQLVIGTDSAYAPFSWRDEGSSLQGIDVELWQAIALDQGLKYKFMARNFDQILEYLEDGKVDAVIAAVNYTDERAKLFDFSDPYFVAGSVVVGSSYGHISKVEDLQGLTVAVKDKTLGELWALQNQEKYKLKIKKFTTATETFMAVHMGTCDFTIVDEPIAETTLQSGLYPGLTVVLHDLIKDSKLNSFFLIVKKGENAQVLEKFNAGLKNIQSSGAYKHIINKYLVSEE